MQQVSCSCQSCKSMCSNSVCLPKPEEARALIRAGYANRLGVYVFDDGRGYVAPATKGHEGKTLPHTNVGGCTFQSSDGLCELHDRNLKPFEGRMSCHDRPYQSIRIEAISSWKGRQFDSVRASLEKAKD